MQSFLVMDWDISMWNNATVSPRRVWAGLFVPVFNILLETNCGPNRWSKEEQWEIGTWKKFDEIKWFWTVCVCVCKHMIIGSTKTNICTKKRKENICSPCLWRISRAGLLPNSGECCCSVKITCYNKLLEEPMEYPFLKVFRNNWVSNIGSLSTVISM